MAMSPRAAQYQPQEKREPAPTAGVFTDWLDPHSAPVTIETDAIFEPSPLAGGPTSGIEGYCNTGLNIILHVVALGCTVASGAIHVQVGDDAKHLTRKMNATDWIGVWCWIMIIGPIVAVALWVVWFGCVRRSFQTPFVATIGGTIFLLVFVCTLKLSYFLEISHYIANNAGGDHQDAGMNFSGHGDPDGLTFVALLFQIYILITSIYTPMSGIYYKLLQVKDMTLDPSSYDLGRFGANAFEGAKKNAGRRMRG